MSVQRPARLAVSGRAVLAAQHSIALQVGVCALLCFGVVRYTGSSNSAPHLIAVLVVSALGWSLAAVGAWRHRRDVGLPAGLLVLALTFWLIGAVGWDVNVLILHKEPFPSWTDPLFLLSYPAMIGAVVVIVRRHEGRRDAAALLDASMITVGVGVVAYTFVIADAAADDSVSALGRIVGVTYPLCDVLVVGVLVRLLVGSAARTKAGSLLVAALASLLVADVAFTASVYAGVADGYDRWIDAPYMLFFLLAGLSLCQRDVVGLAASRPAGTQRVSGARTAALTVGALLAPVTLMVGSVASEVAKVRGAAIGAAIVFLLAMARMSLLMRIVESKRLLLEVLARTDSLTGLPNRRTFDFEFVRAVEAARSSLLAGAVSVAMVDLDYFKAFNDAHGHGAGDQLLANTARIWVDALHRAAPAAMLARYGGEEFAIVLPGADEATAAAVVALLLPLTAERQSFSAGVAQAAPDEEPSDVLARADRRLYVAKQGGRALIVAGGDSGEPVWAERRPGGRQAQAAAGSRVGSPTQFGSDSSARERESSR